MSDSSVQALAHVPRFQWKKWAQYCGITFLIFLTLVIIIALIDRENFFRGQSLAEAVAGSGVIAVMSGLFYGSIAYWVTLFVRKSTFVSSKIDSLQKTSEDLQGALEQDFVTNLVRINFKYIDTYYLQTRVQADKSFNFSVIAAAVSLMLILGGIGLSFFEKTNTAAVSAGAGILGEFIATVFFYLYNQTVAKMADYHRKLVFTQNIGLALKISDGLPPEEKTKAQLALIEKLSTDINQYLGA